MTDTYAAPNDAPILFYCGNEGPVTVFWDNFGFLTGNLAENLKALVVFGEHRYYGESLPFGANSFTTDNLRYLTVDQTLEDYVALIKHFKAMPQYKNSPVIAVGGSYGGMLAAWFRMKYPHIVQVAYAASAPIMSFTGTVSPYAYNVAVSNVFGAYVGTWCGKYQQDGLVNLRQMSTLP